MIVALFYLLLSNSVMAKVKTPDDFYSVRNGDVEYSVLQEREACQRSPRACALRVFLIAKAVDRTLLWKTEIFRQSFDQDQNIDFQENHLVSLRFKEGKLVAEDQSKKAYYLDSKTGKVLSSR